MSKRAWIGFSLIAALGVYGVGCDEETVVDGGGTDGGGGTDSGRVDAGGGADSGGTDAAGGTDSGGTDSGGTDSGVMLGTCTSTPIQLLATCAPVVACGGTFEGTWCYTDVCIGEDELFGGISGCTPAQITVDAFDGQVTGRVVATATNLDRMANLSATFTITTSCLSGVACDFGGGAAIEMALGGGSTATCASSAGGCTCTIAYMDNIVENDDYVIAGDTITTGFGAAQRTYDYCVDGSSGSLSFSETTAGSGGEVGISTISPE